MKNFNLVMLIMEAVCGLICIGFGISYLVKDAVGTGAVFLIVGGLCIITAGRTFLISRKNRKNDDENER